MLHLLLWHLVLRCETNLSTGQRSHYDSEAPVPLEFKSSSEGQLQIEGKENTHQGEEVMKERDHKASVGNEEQLELEESKTVLKLSFSEDQSFSKTCFSEDPKVSRDEDRLLESTCPHESNNEKTGEVSKATEQSRKESFLLEEDEKMDDDSLYNDEYIEPSTDEECRSWRYPQYKVCKEGESVMSEELQEDVCAEEKLELSGLEEEKGGSVADHSDPSEVHDSDCYLVDVSFEMASSPELQEDDESTPEEDSGADQCSLNGEHLNMESGEECKEGTASGDTGISTTIQDQKDTEECTQEDDLCQQYADVAQKEIQTTEDAAQSETKANVQPVDVAADDPALSLTEVQVSEYSLKEEKDPEIEDERQAVIDRLPEETHKAVGGESLKKVTFILEPELINDAALSEARTSEESRAETSMSGKTSKDVCVSTGLPEDRGGARWWCCWWNSPSPLINCTHWEWDVCVNNMWFCKTIIWD